MISARKRSGAARRGDTHRGRVFILPVRGEGFTLVELLIVMVIIVLILGISYIVYHAAARRMDLKGSVEMLKEDIRKTYALADSGESVTDGGVKYRTQYRIEFNRQAGDPGPANTYHILKKSWDLATHAWKYEAVAPDRGGANIVINTGGNQWIKPSASSDIVIASVGGADNADSPTGLWGITFVPKGSIVMTNTNRDTTITLRSNQQNKNTTVTVSIYGAVSQ